MNHESDYLDVNDQVGSNEEATTCKLLDGNTTLGCGDGTHDTSERLSDPGDKEDYEDIWMTRKVHDIVGVVVLDRKPIQTEA